MPQSESEHLYFLSRTFLVSRRMCSLGLTLQNMFQYTVDYLFVVHNWQIRVKLKQPFLQFCPLLQMQMLLLHLLLPFKETAWVETKLAFSIVEIFLWTIHVFHEKIKLLPKLLFHKNMFDLHIRTAFSFLVKLTGKAWIFLLSQNLRDFSIFSQTIFEKGEKMDFREKAKAKTFMSSLTLPC